MSSTLVHGIGLDGHIPIEYIWAPNVDLFFALGEKKKNGKTVNDCGGTRCMPKQ